MMQHVLVKAIYRDGALQLQEPVDLPEGAEVWVELRKEPHLGTETAALQQPAHSPFLHPTRPQSPESLARLTGLVAIGGDALAESEALYDVDWH
jgi:predicted DNA-binding antitoxin AbrB/MazE fold protein